MNRATQIFAAYAEEKLVGILLAEFKDEPRKHSSFWQKLYVKFVDVIQKLFFKGGAGVYDAVNKELFAKYRETHTPDGEIIFLAADPDAKIKNATFATQCNPYQKLRYNSNQQDGLIRSHRAFL